MPTVGLNVESGLMKEMKTAAVLEGLSLREWCCKAFRAYIGNHDATARRDEGMRDIVMRDFVGEVRDAITSPEARERVLINGPNPSAAHAVGCKCFMCKPPKP